MYNKTLLLAIFCAAAVPTAALRAADAAPTSTADQKSAAIQHLEAEWSDVQIRANRGAASQADVLATRVKLAEARIREEQRTIVSAREEQLATMQARQRDGAVPASDVAKADAALREAQLAIIRN